MSKPCPGCGLKQSEHDFKVCPWERVFGWNSAGLVTMGAAPESIEVIAGKPGGAQRYAGWKPPAEPAPDYEPPRRASG